MSNEDRQSTINISLEWKGPFKIGNLEQSINNDDLSRPHVYFYIKSYNNNMCSIYVGMATNFKTRLWDHLTALLGLKYSLLNEDTEWVCPPGKWPIAFDNLGESLRLAEAEVRRCRFYAASCKEKNLKSVEGRLQHRLSEYDNYDFRLFWENERRESDDKNLVLKHYSNNENTQQLITRLFD